MYLKTSKCFSWEAQKLCLLAWIPWVWNSWAQLHIWESPALQQPLHSSKLPGWLSWDSSAVPGNRRGALPKKPAIPHGKPFCSPSERNLKALITPYINFQWEKGIMTRNTRNYSKVSLPLGAGISPAEKFPPTKPQPTAWAPSQSAESAVWDAQSLEKQHSQSSPSLDPTRLLSHTWALLSPF